MSDGVVYVCSNDGRCHALDALTGKRRWVFAADGKLNGESPIVIADLVCFSDLEGNVYALDREDGSARWEAGGSYSVNLVAGGDAVYGVDSASVLRGVSRDTLHAWDAASGRLRWKTEVVPSESTPAFACGRIYHNDTYGNLSAFDAETGEELWCEGSGLSVRGSSNTPCVADGFVYAAAGSKLYKQGVEGAECPWTYRVPGSIIAAATVADGAVYIRSRGAGTYALDAGTGEVRWQRDYRDPGDTELVVTGSTGLVVSGRAANHLYRIDLATGDRIWRRALGSHAASIPTVWHSIAFLATRDSTVIALDATTGRKPGRLADRVRAAFPHNYDPAYQWSKAVSKM